MMHQSIATPKRPRDWCILRTAASQTVALATSLTEAGFEVWTPTRSHRRILIGGRRSKTVTQAAITPTIVFARSDQRRALAEAAAQAVSPHPAFSLFEPAGCVPFVSGTQIAGLREEEQRAAEEFARIEEIEDRDERRKARAAALRTEKARRKAMRAERRTIAPNTSVEVSDMAALAGVIGVVESCDGRSAVVSFGGSLVMTIEAWRLSELDVQSENIAA